MKSDNNQLHPVAHFIKKAYQILQVNNYHHIIHWLPSGKQFAIKDINALQEQILPAFFRHRNIHSFIRQLNMYGFHKSRKDPSKNIFAHQHFQRGREDLLPLVKRKIKNQDRNQENHKVEESQVSHQKSGTFVQEEVKSILSQKNINYCQPEMQKKQSCQKYEQIEINLNPSLNQISLQSMICPSSVMNANSAQIYSNFHDKDDNNDQPEEEQDNLSIEGQIEKERQVFQNRTSGVSLVRTHTLLHTHNNLSDPDI